MKLSITEILNVSYLLSHSIVLSYVWHLISCKSLSFQKCWQTRALSNLLLWLSKVFTDGPEGTEKNSMPISTQKKLPKTALHLLFFIRLVSGVLGVRSGSCQGVSYGLHEGRTTAWADATTGWGDTLNKHKKLTSQQSTRSLTTSLYGCFCYRHIREWSMLVFQMTKGKWYITEVKP